ncbi:MAG: hemolysin family protein [Lentisphaeraceae bacterium]|nr:hemolysin family protein [Lentisphaeraceae bacterium]
MLALISLSIIVLLISALCSGSEAALFSISEIKVKARAEEGSSSALALQKIQSDISRPIAAIVILNNIANISGSMFIGKMAAVQLGTLEGIFSGFFTFAVIICAEIIPKTIGEKHSDPVAFWIAKPVLLLTSIFGILLVVVDLFTRKFTQNDGSTGTLSDENEIRMMANMGRTQGIINHNESILISKVLEMDDVTASSIMTPRVMMTCLDKNLKLGEVKEEVMNFPHSRIVIIDSEPDNVVGIAFKHELLVAMVNEEYEKTLENFSRHVKFVPEQATADNLLRFFQASRIHLAIVTDQYSGVAGIVTLEDVLEVMTGDIVDETDIEANLKKAALEKKESRDSKKRFDETESISNVIS